MNIFGHPIDVWIVVAIAAIVKIMTKTTMGITGAILTAIIGIGAGILLYQPVAYILGFESESYVLVACSITLIFENIARNLVLRTEDPKALDALVGKGWSWVLGKSDKN